MTIKANNTSAIASLFDPASRSRAPMARLAEQRALGDIIATTLAAQMPRVSSWALRPYDFELPYMFRDYDAAMSAMEQMGLGSPTQGAGAGVRRLWPVPTDGRMYLKLNPAANDN